MTNILDKNIGFIKNPFSKFSAEEEKEFHTEIFYPPTFYNTLLDDLKTGTSRFILGQRGHGKSSIIHKLKIDLEKSDVLTIIIDRFDEISLTNNKIEILNLILNQFVTKYVIFLEKNKEVLKKLNKKDKEELALLIKLFFKPLTNSEFEKKYNNVTKIERKNILKKIYNYIIHPTNALLNTGVLITAKLVSESLKLPEDIETKYTDFLKEFDIKSEYDANNDEKKLLKSKRQLKELLDKLNLIAKKSYFKSSVILFDKVDEFQDLEQDIEKIANFSKDLLTDTELLMQNDIAIAFSLWSEVKPTLSKTVRFDKFKEIDIRWTSNDMIPLIDQRIKYFSGGNRKFNDLFDSGTEVKEVITISNKSPRDLISCMSDIYDFQSTRPDVSRFDGTSVSKGLIKFAKRYDYLSMYPSRTAKNKDVLTTINNILRIKKVSFSIKDLNLTFNQKSNWSRRQVELMLKYNLIKENMILGPNNEKIYDVLDPKIIHLIKRNIKSLDEQ
ncbi:MULTISPECIES: P-loop ATPase, Sll1717 family [unclassified Tenacibaculum]|uniref:P-loop ATPase, Sll1717 family n=1 Tax=unclassified Tenacibaculum TaxID=2635139 RepID=UPI001F19453F|nr:MULTISPECIES: hypothetical protein [unclassified Tenacibaculum]MCF2875186.1 hypothetical protein [Tenacibaculum sp. Cn5-1]MCF2935262.1 hypothetical protein [Tenacibaculum sp. Cn5-34]MCG7511296.1 hypothetical protein [Tenacibaculum sp. Cn5-46]